MPFEVSAIDAVLARRLRHSWRPGCPVALEELRHAKIEYLGFDDARHQGELILNRQYAEAVTGALGMVLGHGFPIERVDLVDLFDGDDLRSMEANNTSAYNCRRIEDRPGVWSQHAYGLAIDINPVQNPYCLDDGTVLPAAGKAYLERDPSVTGLIASEGPVVEAFAAIGWSWGGHWSGAKDYQHFSASAR